MGEKIRFDDGSVFDVENGEWENSKSTQPPNYINNSYQWQILRSQYSPTSSSFANQSTVALGRISPAIVVLSIIIAFICVFCFFHFYIGYAGSPAGNYVLDSLTNDGKTETAEEYTRMAKLWKKMGEWEGTDYTLGKLSLNKDGTGIMTIKGDGRDITWNNESIILTEGSYTFPYELENNKLIIDIADITIVFVQKKNRIWIVIGVLFVIACLIGINHNKGNMLLRNLLITTAVVIIGFAIVNPKTTSQQSTESQQEVAQIETDTSSTNTNNERFHIPKYVNSEDLYVRKEAKNMTYNYILMINNIKTTIHRDSIVYLSNSEDDKNGIWVKVQYNDNGIQDTGWVNETYLRDFKITSVRIGNNDDNGNWITYPGKTLYASEIKHLGIQFYVDTINNYDKNTTFYIKLIKPDGGNIYYEYMYPYIHKWTNQINKSDIAYEIPTYFNMSDSDYYTKRRGKWAIEIWYRDPRNDEEEAFACIASKTFELK